MSKVKMSKPDNIDAIMESQSADVEIHVIPELADLLIMYSTSEGFYSFRNETDGSWFIQSLVTELKENPREELLTILTGVNRRVAYAHQSNTLDPRYHAFKQMPNILSTLTKSFYFNREQNDKRRDVQRAANIDTFLQKNDINLRKEEGYRKDTQFFLCCLWKR